MSLAFLWANEPHIEREDMHMTISRILNPFRSHLRIVVSAAVAMLLIVVSAASAPSSGPRIREGKDVKVTLDNNNEDGGTPTPSFDAENRQSSETSVAISPADPNIIAIAAMDSRMASLSAPSWLWLGLYVTDNGGRTWFNTMVPGFPTDTSPAGLASPLKGLDVTFDPVVRFDAEGNLYLAGIGNDRVFDPGDTSDDNLAFIAKYSFTPDSPGGASTPNSAANPPNFTYAFTTIVAQGAVVFSNPDQNPILYTGKFFDKEWIAIDNSPESPCFGNIYYAIARLNSSSSHPHAVFSRSTDGGVTFSQPNEFVQGDGPASAASGGGANFALAPDGTIHIAVTAVISNADPSASEFDPTVSDVRVVRSDDCGEHFAQPVLVAKYPRVPREFAPGLTFHTATFPWIVLDDTDPDVLYVSFMAMDGSPANADVFVARSTDGGATWEAPVKVNDDATRKHQIFPTIAAGDGALHVGWYDFRDSPNPDDPAATNDLLNVYYAVANTRDSAYLDFSPNVKITDVGHQPNCRTVAGLYSLGVVEGIAAFHGDYIELAARFDGRNHIVHFAWADNRDIPEEECDLDSAPGPASNSIGNRNQNIYADTIVVAP
jgi:hypothetical protein